MLMGVVKIRGMDANAVLWTDKKSAVLRKRIYVF